MLCGLLLSSDRARADEPLKPYIVLITDASGSMAGSTGFGSPSCGGDDTKLDHAKCAIQSVASNYGEMILALARFRVSTTDNDPSNGCTMSYIDCDPCNANTGVGCTAAMRSPDEFELLVPLLDENQEDILSWVDFTLGTCYADLANDPELFAVSWTPIAGSLSGVQRYYQGNDPDWVGVPGSDPIRDDPLKDIFIAAGEQCRPYIAILLTDGAETCADFDTYTLGAADALRATVVDGETYRIETKPIGFGMSAPDGGACNGIGDGQIEDLAHHGGATDIPNHCEGYYAANEVELALAFSQIIADAIKVEVCNGEDDDCDLEVDEDFPLLGQPCNDGDPGVCLDTGTYECTGDGTGVECVLTQPTLDPPLPPDWEICNGLDDDCDGQIDEDGVCDGCIGFELCDGKDNDCDGRFDEEITRPCGSDVGECEPGIEECLEVFSEQPSGTWLDCTGTLPQPEDCNGLDDDCNGVIDGLQRPCTTLPDPPGNPNIGVCHDGIQVCPPGGSPPKSWSDFDCQFEVTPAATDWCNGLDDDCDNEIDEDFESTECGTDCGVGYTVCDSDIPAILCEGAPEPEPEDCDNYDDDCNGLVDDGVLTDTPADLDCYDGGLCEPGTLTCLNGEWVCVGGVPPGLEICDCEDNDCDDEVDEGDICAPGSTCVDCQCAFPCGEGEFPCPLGLTCETVEGAGDFCLVDLCYGVDCVPDENGDQTECVEGECLRSCDLITCPGTLVCRGSDGQCVPDNCHSFPAYCAENEFCVDGECVTDPCAGVSCDSDEYCVDGGCVGSCSGVVCPSGETCVLGECKPIPCGGCPGGEVCNETTGECEEDQCTGVNCGEGEACDPLTGECVTDPCLGVDCPGSDEVCVNGSCYGPDHFLPDAGPPPDEDWVAAGGGGGCGAGGGSSSGAVLVILFALLALRRREVAR